MRYKKLHIIISSIVPIQYQYWIDSFKFSRSKLSHFITFNFIHVHLFHLITYMNFANNYSLITLLINFLLFFSFALFGQFQICLHAIETTMLWLAQLMNVNNTFLLGIIKQEILNYSRLHNILTFMDRNSYGIVKVVSSL